LADNCSFQELGVATANVKTLHPEELRRCQQAGASYNEKIRRLDCDFHSLGLGLVGIQESSIQGDVRREQENYTAFTSGATVAGFLGCESWVHKDIVVKHKITAAAISPRLLIVTIRGKLLIKHIVAHAPTAADSEKVRTSFWDTFDAEVAKIPPSFVQMWSIDANGTVGEHVSSAHTHAPLYPETDNGSRLRIAAESVSVQLISTIHHGPPKPTWYGGSRRKGRRIDFIGASVGVDANLISTESHTDVFIGGTTEADHVLQSARLNVRSGRSASAAKAAPRLTDKAKLRDPWIQWQFEDFLWHHRELAGGNGLIEQDPNEVFDVVTDIMQQGQKLFFAPDHAQSTARKPWASQWTVTLADDTPALRKSLHIARAKLKKALVTHSFFAWRYGRARSDSAITGKLHQTRLNESWHLLQIRLHRSAVSSSITKDVDNYVYDLAQQANTYAEAGDSAGVFKIAKLLQASRDKPHDTVLHENASVLVDDDEISARWTRRWQSLYNADRITIGDLIQSSKVREVQIDDRLPDLPSDVISKMIDKANPHKATGLDGVEISTWKAGGNASAALAGDVLNSSRRHAKAPVKIKGGRIQSLYKGKGDRKDVNNSRGLLIQPFLGKMHGGSLKHESDQAYKASVSNAQCGAFSGRNASMAGLLAELHSDWARHNKLSWSRIYVDLTAAFDSVMRELALTALQPIA
jgi:hypothetical protein